VRIDTELKQTAEELFTDIGLDTSSVVRLFLKQAVAHQEIPCPLTRPTEKKGTSRMDFTQKIEDNFAQIFQKKDRKK
jgi:addiction module RelB/DinJ family antitoxin